MRRNIIYPKKKLIIINFYHMTPPILIFNQANLFSFKILIMPLNRSKWSIHKPVWSRVSIRVRSTQIFLDEFSPAINNFNNRRAFGNGSKPFTLPLRWFSCLRRRPRILLVLGLCLILSLCHYIFIWILW